MPIAATGQPATPEPRVCLQLPSGAEPVPKRGRPCEDLGAGAEARGHSGGPLELGRDLLGASAAETSYSPPAPSPLALPLHGHLEPPRTRSRSRSGFYGSNGVAGTTLQQQQQQQYLGYTENLRPPGNVLSPGSHRHSGPGANRNSVAGKVSLMLFLLFLLIEETLIGRHSPRSRPRTLPLDFGTEGGWAGPPTGASYSKASDCCVSVLSLLC